MPVLRVLIIVMLLSFLRLRRVPSQLPVFLLTPSSGMGHFLWAKSVKLSVNGGRGY